ncbi:tRNA (N(6)-L-threonylcarbamoyladenosine(37)-C(2))-methylthiotransferase MtaB [Tunicatimonas pelagia]|uniref:tRNA (N(6)-L-threonylcarbamoyladenosine(37)-C(2))- methylthiotransferase MtaB n=1 Tax=Tunicatimonas pelagia TaxID=931531 RepID=UPI0026662F1C|nr:tRNA (N(6)-L-threonylcarbamoyladenosine(37)-C(2))-methylthiotransferase MtaB [Tunicatimonas pelagia]WKN40495.1 tRNA (N(6)-L-threonylcarbamoyladenosine(37)-C(2))-methylthiotransferase MtaB [Tunicatimonas pelagia]
MEEASRSVAFYTLGCKLNYSETSTLGRLVEERGYRKTNFQQGADIYIINTCSVTDNADKKCRKVVREALKYSPSAYVCIVGCYAQLKPKEIAEIPGVDAVLGAAEKFRLLDLLDGFQKKSEPQVFASEVTEARRFNSAYSLHDRTRTFLKVQDGCNYHCTFCTIPLARGKSRSDTVESVVNQAREIAQTGVKEIVLTGVNIGDYGIIDGKRTNRFIDLVQELDQVEGINRFRISSIEPNLLSNEVIEFVAQSQRFVPHFHIPLQSGANKILRQMRRRYLRELYADRVQKIKTLMPHCAIGVDVIVGFPGETEEDFLETYHFLNSLPISYLHVFTYSERANTPAAEMDAVVPMKTRQQRSKMLRTLSEKKRRKFYQENLEQTATVLYEEDVEDGQMHGFTENYVRVSTPYDPLLINELQSVQLGEINELGTVTVAPVSALVL